MTTGRRDRYQEDKEMGVRSLKDSSAWFRPDESLGAVRSVETDSRMVASETRGGWGA